MEGIRIGLSANDTKEQNVQFSDQMQTPIYDVVATTDPTRTLNDGNDMPLSDFVKRPTLITTLEWGTGAELQAKIDPWTLFFENPRIINRINNYKLMRAKLHVKFVINGNGFYFGRAIGAYLPMDLYDNMTNSAATNVQQTLIQKSQLPKVFLDPTTSQGGELVLPFFWHKNYLNVQQAEWRAMGALLVQSINTLHHANGGTGSISINVFAWADEVQLSGLTDIDSNGLVPQSGSEIDEANAKGVISGPATAIARVSNALVHVPTIGPFATATSALATSVGGMAKLFGLSRPNHTVDPSPYRPTVMSSLATTTTPDNAQKLTVDDKQELTIDPAIAGLSSEDMLSIKAIAARESFITKFTWPLGAPTGNYLWNSVVTPVIWDELGDPKGFYFPACAAAALPFDYWTGTMKFRFQIVCSAFHKGRLRVVYDPEHLSGSDTYNTTYSQIVDIADKTDFTFEVANSQTRTLLRHSRPGFDTKESVYNTVRHTSTSSIGNGVIGIQVLNELTVPNSTAAVDIEINVFVSMGDDFEVFVPSDYFNKFVFAPQSGEEFPNQSGEIVTEAQNTPEPSYPIQQESTSIAIDKAVSPYTNLVFSGESITSFRQMLKRYNHHVRIGPDTSCGHMNYRAAMFPFFRGAVPGAKHATAGGATYNYCNTVLTHWVTSMFSGWRGSMRYKFVLNGDNYGNGLNAPNRPRGMMRVERVPQDNFIGFWFFNWQPKPIATTTDQNSYFGVVREGDPDSPSFSGAAGAAYTTTDVNNTLEIEMPFYHQDRFYPGKHNNYTDVGNLEYFNLQAIGNFDFSTWIDVYTAVGEDYQAYFFTGLPVVYWEIAPPLPEV
jgi:hypothetical protein